MVDTWSDYYSILSSLGNPTVCSTTDPLTYGVAERVTSPVHGGSYSGRLRYKSGDGSGMLRAVDDTKNKTYYKVKGYLYLPTSVSDLSRLELGVGRYYQSTGRADIWFAGINIKTTNEILPYGRKILADGSYSYLTLVSGPSSVSLPSSAGWFLFEAESYTSTSSKFHRFTIHNLEGSTPVWEWSSDWTVGGDWTNILIHSTTESATRLGVIFDDLEYYV